MIKKPALKEWMGICDNLTDSQTVGAMDALIDAANPYIFNPKREGWDLRWEVERLQKAVNQKDEQIGKLRYEVVMLKTELNATRGRKK